MNREIKFRVWNKKTNRWVHPPGLEVNLFGETILLGGFMHGVGIKELNDCIALQYTGLKDKNGKEIYEGDIVNYHDYQGWEDGRTFTGYYEVKWNEEYLRFDFYEACGNVWWELADTQFDRVVGNLYENPELLK